MNKSEKSENLDFPINQALLGEATKIKEQWKVIKERIDKIKENKEKVSTPVFQRVLADYQDRLEKITEEVLEKKNLIDRELVTLYETQNRIAAELETHRHSLEEVKFRNMLGEFSEEEYQRKAKEEQEKISKFESVLAAVNTNISRYEELFREEVELLSLEEKKIVHAETAEEEIPLEEFAEEGRGADYFTGGPEVTSPKEEPAELSATMRTARTKIGERSARIVIISGDDAGATYPIKDSITFGRAESNTVVLRDAKVSRQHAKIVNKGGEFVLMDMNSSNGTFVNGERIEEYVLTDNDEFSIGDTTLQFQF
jgi:hypothetical protein